MLVGPHEASGQCAMVSRSRTSPRVRGTRLLADGRLPDHGFIPARAGNAGTRTRWRPIDDGSSPRVRGTLRPPRRMGLSPGSSPRVRGTLAAGVLADARIAVHPRACGERVDALRTGDGTGRFIPARAGNAPCRREPPSPATVHPRACGERADPWAASLRPRFIPARAGNAAERVAALTTVRFIPARAGNAPSGDAQAGENRFIPARAGNARRDQPSGAPTRFIPARAGNASGAWPWPSPAAVHPRACGERGEAGYSSGNRIDS